MTNRKTWWFQTELEKAKKKYGENHNTVLFYGQPEWIEHLNKEANKQKKLRRKQLIQNMMKNLTLREIILFFGIVAVIAFWLTRESCNKADLKEQKNLNEALNSQLITGVNKYGQYYAERMAFMTDKANEFSNASLGYNETVLELQRVVRDMKKQLKGGDNVTVFNDSTIINNTTNNIYPANDSSTRISKYNDKWIDYTIISKPDSTTLNLGLTDMYSVAFTWDRIALDSLKPKKKKLVPVGIVTSMSPYTRIKDVRTYAVTLPKPPRIGIGIQVGAGVTYNGQVFPGIYAGVGIQYTFFHFKRNR